MNLEYAEMSELLGIINARIELCLEKLDTSRNEGIKDYWRLQLASARNLKTKLERR